MKTSEQMTKMPAALLKAQATITFAAKGSVNAHFKNKYADLAAVIDAVKSALNDNGIAFVQTASPSQDGFLNLTTRLIHESGEWIEDTLTMPLQKCDPQGYGSAMTYARRYSLAAITGLYQDDDDGNQACRPKQEAKAEPSRIDVSVYLDRITKETDIDRLRSMLKIDIKAACASAGDMGAFKTLEAACTARAAELKQKVAA